MRSGKGMSGRFVIARRRSVAWFGLVLALTAADAGCQARTVDSPTPKQTQTQSSHLTRPGHRTSRPPLSEIDLFIERREACDHFRGEDPYDAARRAFLKRKLSETCKGTDAELSRLRRKYRDSPHVVARLFAFDDHVE